MAGNDSCAYHMWDGWLKVVVEMVAFGEREGLWICECSTLERSILIAEHLPKRTCFINGIIAITRWYLLVSSIFSLESIIILMLLVLLLSPGTNYSWSSVLMGHGCARWTSLLLYHWLLCWGWCLSSTAGLWYVISGAGRNIWCQIHILLRLTFLIPVLLFKGAFCSGN